MKIPGTVLGEIDGDGKRGWTVEINGVRVENACSVRISSPVFGVLAYGLDPAGYDRRGFHENGGGGSVIVPYARVVERLYVGLVQQKRVNQGGEVWNVPRGFLNEKETHFQAAVREVDEGLGGGLASAHKPVEPVGDATNQNSAFFETCNTREDGSKEGVRFFLLAFRPDELMPVGDGQLGFRPGVLTANAALMSKKLAEQILGCRFMPARDAVRVSDMFTVAAIARLANHLGLLT